jgi:Aspartyl protease
MKKIILSSFALILFGQSSFAQQNLPIIKASSNSVDVRIYGFLKKEDWTIDPKKSIDVYYIRRTKNSTPITFITNMDSISFDVKKGIDYDFIILLNGKDSCYTRVKTLKTYRTPCQNCVISQDTIPFTLGRDNRMYIDGKINDSETIKILYDNGAEGTGLAKSALDKVKLNIDGTGESRGTGGTIQTQTSSTNKLQIGKLIWDDEFISIGNKKYGIGADAIVGYSMFSDKVVEIDYDKSVMIIHDKLPQTTGYAKVNVQFYDFLPSVEASLIVGNKVCKDWFLIDIGASGTAMVNTYCATKNSLYNTMEKIGEGATTGIGNDKIKNELVILPKLLISEKELLQVPINIELPSKSPTGLGNLLGMDVLKRFNTIIDYPNSTIYLKPNNLLNTPFKKQNDMTLNYIIGVSILLGLLVIGFFIYRRRKFNLKSSKY